MSDEVAADGHNPVAGLETTPAPPSAPPRRPGPAEPGQNGKQPLPAMALTALGVVFGDLGTSPLYSLQTVFSLDHNAVEPTPEDVYGVISLVFWTLTMIVTIKYALLVMRADNDGEGGILALVALLRHKLQGRTKLLGAVTIMGILGAGLFYGDSVITPAISVLSAIEGLDLVTDKAHLFILPAAIIILTVLFIGQRFGTEKVGRAFGPVMAIWFVTIAVLGVPSIIGHPEILLAASPHHAFGFMLSRPIIAFIAMGAVVLCITGAEALYADMGHFGPGPIRFSWFVVVMPCLLLNYFGQGAMILHNPATIDSPFFHLAPGWARIPLVILATLATVIASQAVISGAFSVSQQAARLRLVPRLAVKHTSKQEGGQIYIGSINWILYIGVLVLIVVFQSSERLATAYGLAVTGTLILTTTIFLFLAHHVWRWAPWRLIVIGVAIGGLELIYLGANVLKLLSGGWIPLVIATVVIVIMTTWMYGQAKREEVREALEGPLDEFIKRLRSDPVQRVPGVAVFPHPDRPTTPLALRENVEFNHVLHETIVIVSIVNENVPHIRHVDRAAVTDLGYSDDGIVHVRYHVGFNDSQDIPKAIEWAMGKVPEMNFDPNEARYFLSILRVAQTGLKRTWRGRLFIWLASKEANRTVVFHLPAERTIIMGAHASL